MAAYVAVATGVKYCLLESPVLKILDPAVTFRPVKEIGRGLPPGVEPHKVRPLW